MKSKNQLLAIALSVLVFLMSAISVSRVELKGNYHRPKTIHELQEEALSNESIKREILWFARAIYSETKRPREQELVAWVIRNRVDTHWNGKTKYESIVRAPMQFSGLNSTDQNYHHNVSMNFNSHGRAWISAIRTAIKVYYSDPSDRPFSITTRHFISPRSLTSNPPNWTENKIPVRVVYSGRERNFKLARFAFYDDVN